MMILRLFFVYLLLLVSATQLSWGADIKALKNLFESTWTSNYVEGRCGENIERLVSLALDQGIDLDGAEIVRLVDHGGWMFGMVNALQVREDGRLIEPKPTRPPFRHPGEANWYFHAFLLVDNKVMDYDFTNQPKIIPLMSYLHEMFLPKEKWNDPKYKDSKMRLYEIERFPAEDYILRLRSRMSRSDISVTQKLKDYVPGFFKTL